MAGEPRISVVVRFRNEARYLEAVLRAVQAQRCRFEFEIIGVDNASSDGSRQIADKYADRVVFIDEYRPGRALNAAIEESIGDYLVPLSAHAVPHSDRWLEDLTAHLRNPEVLGIYGGQVYPAQSRFLDKRDLDIFCTDAARTEAGDSDFWNANSALRRDDWLDQQFDESVTELEDHHWTKALLQRSIRWVRFEPSAVVYHYGHDTRNDRVSPPRSDVSPAELVHEAIRVLEGTTDPSWPARMAAGLTLGSLDQFAGVRVAVPAMGRRLLEDPDFDVRWRMASALGRIGGEDVVPFLVRGLTDPSFYVRDECAWSLARVGPTADAGLLRSVPGLDEQAVPFAGLALGLGGGPDARQRGVDLLRAGVLSDDRSVELDSVYFLGELSPDTVPGDTFSLVERRLDEARSVEMARAAAWCWGRLATVDRRKASAAVKSLARRHPSELVREEAVIALSRAAGGRLTQGVVTALTEDGAGRVRFAAAQCVRHAATQDAEAARLLKDLPADPDFGVEFERALAVGDQVRY